MVPPWDESSVPDSILRRRLKVCGGCGIKNGLYIVEGSKIIDGMPGIFYNVCPGCGWSRAITSKAPKEKLH